MIEMEEEKKQDQEKMQLKEYFGFKEVFGYFFRKKDPDRPRNFNLRMMHGINKISILIFLMGLTVMIIRAINR